jgi:hypothetical protein
MAHDHSPHDELSSANYRFHNNLRLVVTAKRVGHVELTGARDEAGVRDEILRRSTLHDALVQGGVHLFGIGSTLLALCDTLALMAIAARSSPIRYASTNSARETIRYAPVVGISGFLTLVVLRLQPLSARTGPKGPPAIVRPWVTSDSPEIAT